MNETCPMQCGSNGVWFPRRRRCARAPASICVVAVLTGCCCLLSVDVSLTAIAAADEIPVDVLTRTTAVSFDNEIQPILRRSCLACHSENERSGELVLETSESILAGGDSGPAIVPGHADDSLLLRLASHREDPVMPPEDNDVAAPNLTSQELGLIRLWIEQGAERGTAPTMLSPTAWQTLPPGIHPAQAIALSEDGQLIACSRANVIDLYHVPTGQLVTRLSDPALNTGDTAQAAAHRDLVQSLAFNRDADLLASGGFREVRLWRRPRDVQRYQLSLERPGTAVAFSAASGLVATASADNSIRLWDRSSGAPRGVLTGHTDRIRSLVFTVDGNRLISGSTDQTVRIWDAQQAAAESVIGSPAAVNAVALVDTASPTEQNPAPPQMIVTGGEDNLLRTWLLPDKTAPPVPINMTAPRLAEFSRDGGLVAFGGADGHVRVVRAIATEELPIGADVVALQIDGEAAALAFGMSAPADAADQNADAPVVAVATGGADVTLVDARTGSAVDRWQAGDTAVRAIACSVDGHMLATGHDDGSIRLWSLDAGPAAALSDSVAFDSVDAGFVVAMSPQRRLIAVSGSLNGRPVVQVLRVADGQQLATLSGCAETLRALSIAENESQIAAVSGDHSVCVWDLTSGNPAEPMTLQALQEPVTAICVDNQRGRILVAGAEGIVRLFQWAEQESSVVAEFKGHAGGVTHCGFRNGQPVTFGSDLTCRIWNVADGSQLNIWSFPSIATHVSVLPDWQRIAIAGADHQLRVLLMENGAVQHTVALPVGEVSSMSLASDGSRVAVDFRSGIAQIISVPDGRLMAGFHSGVTEGSRRVSLFSSETAELLTADDSGRISRRRQRFAGFLEGNTQRVSALEFSANGQLLISGCADGSLRGFSIQDKSQRFATNHGAEVQEIRFSGNDAILATAGTNALVRLWQANGGGYGPQQLSGFRGNPSRLAWTPDNARLISIDSGDSPELLVHDVTSGAVLERSGPFTHRVLALQAHLRGESVGDTPLLSVQTATAAGIARWQPAALRQMTGHNQPITALAAVPGSPWQVLSGSRDSTVRRWQLTTAQQLQQLNHGGAVTGVAIRPDGQRVAAVSDNHIARLWNINGQQVAEFRGDNRRRVLQSRAQQQQAAAGQRLNIAKQLQDTAEKDVPVRAEAEKKFNEALQKATADLAEKKVALEKATAERREAEKNAIAASAAARQALVEKDMAERASGEADRAVVSSQTRLARLQQALGSDATNPALQQLVTAAQTELQTAQQQASQAKDALQAPAQKSQEMAVLANEAASKASDVQKPFNDALAAVKLAEAEQNLASQQHVLAARELQQAQELVPVRTEAVVRAEAAVQEAQQLSEKANMDAQAADLAMQSVAFSPDGTLLVTGGELPDIQLWDAETGAPLSSVSGHAGPVPGLVFADSDSLLSVSEDGQAICWNVHPGWQLERIIGSADQPELISHRVTSLDFSRDGMRLVIASGIPSRSGELLVVQVRDGAAIVRIPEAHEDVVYAAQFSPDGTRIASAGADRYVRIFDAAAGVQLRRLEGHTNYALSVAWKGDGQMLASAGADNTIRIWDAETGDQQRTIENFGKHVTGVRFMGETDNVVSSSGDRMVRMHSASNGGNFRNLAGATVWLHCVEMTPDGTLVAAGDAEGNVLLWNAQNGQLLKTLGPTPATMP